MLFKIDTPSGTGLMDAVAASVGGELENRTLTLPDAFGKGYMKEIDLSPFLRMVIHQYEIQNDVTVRKKANEGEKDIIVFSFRNVFNQVGGQKEHPPAWAQTGKLLPSVQVSSGDIDIEFSFPAKTQINTIIIAVHARLLNDLMHPQEGSPLLQTILSGRQPYLYEEILSPAIQEVAAQIITANVPPQLYPFYYKLRAQELIYFFFSELLKRQDTPSYPINAVDVKQMYAVRDQIISDLSSPPNLPELAHRSGMSESKMKRLFKQIFGDSIYNYYQAFRMAEAAYLIKEQKLSVSEAGLRLGFTNLSHFTRIFEKHIGLKPKKYSTAG